MSKTVLFGRVTDPELIVLNFRGQLQCRMGGKREGPIVAYPKFWNLNPVAKNTREEGSLENPGVEEKLRFPKERTGDYT